MGPTQDDAMQFIKLERFRRDRHRMRSSDLDSETESSEDDTAGTSRERGAKLPPWMAKSANTEQLATTDTTIKPTSSATTVNQPGEMINPAGEAVPMSSSSESEEDEERAAKMRAMAAKFNPAQIYGEATVEKKDGKKSEKKKEKKLKKKKKKKKKKK